MHGNLHIAFLANHLAVLTFHRHASWPCVCRHDKPTKPPFPRLTTLPCLGLSVFTSTSASCWTFCHSTARGDRPNPTGPRLAMDFWNWYPWNLARPLPKGKRLHAYNRIHILVSCWGKNNTYHFRGKSQVFAVFSQVEVVGEEAFPL